MDNFEPIPLEEFEEDAEKLDQEPAKIGMLDVRSGNEWVKEGLKKPTPEMLFDEFWFEGEICILFADTNVGKSILAVQMGDSISKGVPIKGFRMTAEKQPVLYFDFELSFKQFQLRYTDSSGNAYRFDDGFSRIEIDNSYEVPDNVSFEDSLAQSIEGAIKLTGSRVLIIDNITYLKNETERAKDALPLMKQLKALKSRYGLSILLLTHTPKRDPFRQLTKNDQQGSRMVMNFCDSSFAIGECQSDLSLRYLKQIKQRNLEITYHSGKVRICRIAKPSTFLGFEFIGYGSELEHLRQPDDNGKTERNRQIAKMFFEEDKSEREIGRIIGISHTTVQNIIKQLKET